MKPLQFGGVDDHIHYLLGVPATMAPAKAAQLIKGSSSSWINTEFPALRRFAWQDGYGAFTVSKSHLQDVIAYIQNQRQGRSSQTSRFVLCPEYSTRNNSPTPQQRRRFGWEWFSACDTIQHDATRETFKLQSSSGNGRWRRVPISTSGDGAFSSTVHGSTNRTRFTNGSIRPVVRSPRAAKHHAHWRSISSVQNWLILFATSPMRHGLRNRLTLMEKSSGTPIR